MLEFSTNNSVLTNEIIAYPDEPALIVELETMTFVPWALPPIVNGWVFPVPVASNVKLFNTNSTFVLVSTHLSFAMIVPFSIVTLAYTSNAFCAVEVTV